MTREEATEQVQGFFRAYDVDSPGLNEHGLGGASLDTGDIYFQYLPARGALRCSALIYRFRGPPNPGVLAAFEEEAKLTETGGGRLEYEPTNRGVYLSRLYEHPTAPATFKEQLQKLLEACQRWQTEVVERVAARAYGRGE